MPMKPKLDHSPVSAVTTKLLSRSPLPEPCPLPTQKTSNWWNPTSPANPGSASLGELDATVEDEFAFDFFSEDAGVGIGC